MNKRSSRSGKTDILIDLTSLLDIVFIVLLIVMCGQQLVSADSAARAEEADKKLEEATELYNDADERIKYVDALVEAYNMHMDAYDNFDRYVTFIDVVAYYDSSASITDRTIHIYVGYPDKYEWPGISVNSGNEADAYTDLANALKVAIEDAAGQESPVPVILSLNSGDDKILYRDEVAITNIFNKLAESYDNVFIR